MSNTSTNLDNLIEYKNSIIYALANSQKVVGLLLDNPNINMDSDEAYDVVNKNIYDYDYVDKTVERSDAYIMVEVSMAKPISGSMNRWVIYVQVVSAKSYNTLNKKKFKGVKGNRKDNLMREIDLLLNGRDDFGIGKLCLSSAAPSSVPDSFTSSMLTYEIADFREERLRKT